MLRVYPMDFGEFLLANVPQMYEVLRDGDWTLIEAFASKLKEQLRQYYFVGGMPEVVADFVTHHDQARVRQLQQDILNAYRNDISKHTTPTESMRIGQVLESLPSQLAKENKKFIYGAIKKGARNNVFTEFKGAFTEEFVMQQLVAGGLIPYYWSSETTPAEIDFVVENEDAVFPIEVKAEENVRAKSMAAYIGSHPDDHLHGLRFSMKGYERQDWMTNVPLYEREILARWVNILVAQGY